MEWLNYHHLRYFWAVAREGSIARASKSLRIAQPTISEQLKQLEEALGERLFERHGRGLALTEVGRVVFGYAEEIFSLGRELQETLSGKPTGRPARLSVGVADVVPKPVAFELLAPALRLPHPVQLVCREASPERLIAELAQHTLDLVLVDAPAPPSGGSSRVYSHLLGESTIAVFGESRLAARYKARFPRSLDGAPMLLPHGDGALRRSLDAWLEQRGIRPQVVGELQDSALQQVFAEAGMGLFAAPSAIEGEMARQHGLVRVGELEPLRAHYYAITGERRIKKAEVAAVLEGARQTLFQGG